MAWGCRVTAGERIVELIVETTGSLNTEITQASGIPPSDDYSAFLLARTGWVDSELCTSLAESARLRNAIVRRYEDLSLDKIHAAIHQLAPLWRRYFEALDARLRSQGHELEGVDAVPVDPHFCPPCPQAQIVPGCAFERVLVMGLETQPSQAPFKLGGDAVFDGNDRFTVDTQAPTIGDKG